MVAVATGTCTAAQGGRYSCDCADCAASVEAEGEHDFLSERGMDYAYSGYSGSAAMEMARRDLEDIKQRARLPQLRRDFKVARAAWYDHRVTAEAPALWARMLALFTEGNEIAGRYYYTPNDAAKDLAADVTAWIRKNG